jgi:hypothetical protein
MWSFAVVVGNPFAQDLAQVPFVQRNHPIEALAPDGADKAFAISIRLRRGAPAFAAPAVTST